MVNGRTLREELERIDVFFENLSIEELENIAFECGLGEIAPSYRSRYGVANNTDDFRFSVKNNQKVLEAA